MYIYTSHHLTNISKFFFTAVGCVFIFISPALAEEKVQEKRSCTEEMVYAVSRIEMNFEEELDRFLDLRSSQADAKAKNLTLYLQNYECQLQYVCQAFESPTISILGSSLTLCKAVESQKFLGKNDIDFTQCSGETLLGGKTSRLDLCQQFIRLKQKASFDFTEKSFTNQSAKENQSFLASKLAGMQKRMNILYEKTRLFSRNFNKVMHDISCSLPDKSA